MCTALEIETTVSRLLGSPASYGWVLRFPDHAARMVISLRSGFSTHGALWFEETAGDACRTWLLPLDAPNVLNRVRQEIDALLAEGGVTASAVSR